MKRKDAGFIVILLCMLGLVAQADVTSVVSSADTTTWDATSTHGSDVFIDIYGTGTVNHMGYVRFELAPLRIDTISNASLIMTVSGGATRNDTVNTGRYAPHGLLNLTGNTPQSWNEATLNQSGTGLEVNWTTRTLDFTRVIDLDNGVSGITETFVAAPAGGYAAGSTLTTTGSPLVNFLNARVADGGLVTFIINGEMTNTRGYGLATRENSTVEYRPTLVLTHTTKGASNPQPAVGTKVSPMISQLSWSNLASYPKCDVYFGREPNVMTMAKLTFEPAVTSVNIAAFPGYSLPLDPNTYYWRVDCYEGSPVPSAANLPGSYWNFIATYEPLATTNPADQYKFAGETAVFTAVFSSIDPVTYAWYRSVDNTNNTAADDTLVGTNSNTLTLSNVSLADVGYYYCKATNPTEGRTNTARLSIKRQYAYWALNGNANDSSGNNLHGTLYGIPSFTTGAAGDANGAMTFDGTDDYIKVLDPNNFSDFYPGMTLSVWARPSAAANWARFIDFGNGAPNDNIYFARNGTTTNLTFGVHIGTSAGALTVTANGALVLNEWQLLVVTVDESRNVVIYKNGLSVATGTISQKPTIIPRSSNLIGDSNWTADAFYAGAMDDLQIWNYAKTANDVADLYSAVVGNFCRTRPGYDWDNNCKVDLPDFASVAAQWLNCGLYPNCP